MNKLIKAKPEVKKKPFPKLMKHKTENVYAYFWDRTLGNILWSDTGHFIGSVEVQINCYEDTNDQLLLNAEEE